MNITNKINKQTEILDVFVSVKVTCLNRNKIKVMSNMPNTYKEIYYKNKYDNIDDTFNHSEANSGSICYPNTRKGNYTSEYIKKMESHGYFNLMSYSFHTDDYLFSFIVTLPEYINDLKYVTNTKKDEFFKILKIIISLLGIEIDISHLSDIKV